MLCCVVCCCCACAVAYWSRVEPQNQAINHLSADDSSRRALSLDETSTSLCVVVTWGPATPSAHIKLSRSWCVRMFVYSWWRERLWIYAIKREMNCSLSMADKFLAARYSVSLHFSAARFGLSLKPVVSAVFRIKADQYTGHVCFKQFRLQFTFHPKNDNNNKN